jgi:hypothetical protein
MENKKELRSIILVDDQVYYSTGLQEIVLPVRPTNMDELREPRWQKHKVWAFSLPDLYTNQETCWFQDIPADLKSFYDEEQDVYILEIRMWDWFKETAEETNARN